VAKSIFLDPVFKEFFSHLAQPFAFHLLQPWCPCPGRAFNAVDNGITGHTRREQAKKHAVMALQSKYGCEDSVVISSLENRIRRHAVTADG
jgi:hypothetical protein